MSSGKSRNHIFILLAILVVTACVFIIVKSFPKGDITCDIAVRSFSDFGARQTYNSNDLKDAISFSTPAGVFMKAEGPDIERVFDAVAVTPDKNYYDSGITEAVVLAVSNNMNTGKEIKGVCFTVSFDSNDEAQSYYDKMTAKVLNAAQVAKNNDNVYDLSTSGENTVLTTVTVANNNLKPSVFAVYIDNDTVLVINISGGISSELDSLVSGILHGFNIEKPKIF
ncbi:MAG: hypothetical protein IKT14_07720 [Clostridiales bacterium]|nr:hypothetical protein [Clostridiales bacterium]